MLIVTYTDVFVYKVRRTVNNDLIIFASIIHLSVLISLEIPLLTVR